MRCTECNGPAPWADDVLSDIPPCENCNGTGEVPAAGRLVDLRGYDPVHHNLMGIDVLAQDQRWKTKDGSVIELTAMTVSHRRNLLAFLRRNAAKLEFRDGMIALTGPMAPRGEMAAEDLGDYLADRDPDEWLNSTPLVQRLAQLVAADEATETARAAEEVAF